MPPSDRWTQSTEHYALTKSSDGEALSCRIIHPCNHSSTDALSKAADSLKHELTNMRGVLRKQIRWKPAQSSGIWLYLCKPALSHAHMHALICVFTCCEEFNGLWAGLSHRRFSRQTAAQVSSSSVFSDCLTCGDNKEHAWIFSQIYFQTTPTLVFSVAGADWEK